MIARRPLPLCASLLFHLPSIISSITGTYFWLVVVFAMAEWRPSKAKVSHLFNLFLPFESLTELMQRWYPTRSTPAEPPFQHPTCRGRQLSVNCCVLLLIGGHLRANPPPITLFFDALNLFTQMKETLAARATPTPRACCGPIGSDGSNDLGAWLTLRRQYRENPLGGRAVAAHLGVVVCCVLFGPKFVFYFAPITVVQIFNPLTLPSASEKRSYNQPCVLLGAHNFPQNIPVFRRSIRIPPCGHTMSIMEIQQWSYFQNITGV